MLPVVTGKFKGFKIDLFKSYLEISRENGGF
jgi:hypothetical protein